jgi:hypothetical protein
MRGLTILMLVFAASLASAYEVSFPAITGNEGAIVTANITCVPGRGNGVSLDLPPSFDKATIDSLINAYALAKAETGSHCASTVSFGPEEGQIEGPSGGLRFFLFYHSVLSGKGYGEKTMATGQIDGNGGLYPVGGELEKAEKAKEEGYKQFIAMPSTIYDYYALSGLNGTDFQVVLVNDIQDAAAFAENGNVPTFDPSYLVEMPKETNITSPYNSSWLKPHYAWMEQDFIYQLNRSKMPDGIRAAYMESYRKSEQIASLGYDYSAANYLFLNLANVRAFNRIADNRKINRSEVDSCVAGPRAFSPDIATYELYAGAVSRFERANELAFDYTENISSTEFGNAYALEKALLWCRLAESLLNSSAKGSINTDVMQAVLKSGLYNASWKGDDVERARRLYVAGEYLASYHELAYFMAEDSPMPQLRENYTTKWGNAFASQAYYLNMTGQQSAGSASLANYMEQAKYFVSDAEQGSVLIGNSAAVPGQGAAENGFKMLIVLIAIAAVLAAAYLALGRNVRRKVKKHGSGRKGH